MPSRKKGDPPENFEDWKRRHEAGEESPRVLFRQVSHIAQFLTYDLIDKLQWWEKQTLELPDEQIDERIPHMAVFLEQLKTAYETFADLDL